MTFSYEAQCSVEVFGIMSFDKDCLIFMNKLTVFTGVD